MPSLHLTDFNESERADYMVVVASMAHSHGEATAEDLYALRELCMRYVLGPEARGRVIGATSNPPESLESLLHHLGHSKLRYSLFLDVCTMAYHHGSLGPAEEKEIRHIADTLKLTDPQVKAIEAVAKLLTATDRQVTHADVEKSLGVAEHAGVPQGALAIAATLMGLNKEEHAPVRETMVARRGR